MPAILQKIAYAYTIINGVQHDGITDRSANFFASHSLRWLTPHSHDWLITRLGQHGYKALFAVVSLLGLVLIIWGYSISRGEPVVLWVPPVWPDT